MKTRPRIMIGLCLPAAALVAFAAVWWLGRPARYLEEARRRLDEGEPAAATPWLALPEATPATRDQALLLRARAAVEGNRPADAVGSLNRIDPNGSYATDAAYWKGRALYSAGNARLAGAWFRRALERRPGDADSLRWLAAAAYDLGDWKSAVAALEQLTALQPDDARAWRTLALLYKEENHFETARAAYEASLRHDPSQPKARLEWAETLIKLGRFADAETQLGLCRGGVAEADRLALLAQCLRARDDRVGLRRLLDAGLENDPAHPGLLSQRAGLAQVEGRAAEALADLDRAVAAAPSDPQLAYQRSLALAQLGRKDEGQRELARSTALTRREAQLSDLTRRATERPDDPRIRCELATLALDLGDTRQAVYWYRAALACDPTHEPARAGLLALEGR